MTAREEPDDEEEEQISRSRRGIDYFTAEKWVRIDERLKNVELKAIDAYEEIYGGKGKVGLSEQMRNMLKVWGVITVFASGILGSWTWIWDKLKGTGNDGALYGREVEDRWKQESKKRVRIFNKETGAWEYFYMLSDKKVDAIEKGGRP